MKQLTIGILAHVDSGKTTLSEALLYCTGAIRNLGRVDKRNSFLDTNSIERDRGITIFSKQAQITCGDTEITILDTPGHTDFSAETERTLQVLDCAVLVISASDGVQGHTETLWSLLKRHNIPVFIFVNKMDLPDTSAEKIIDGLRKKFGDGFVNFNNQNSESFCEAIAMCDEDILNEYLDTNTVSDKSIASATAKRKVFPCCFGSALKLDGVSDFLDVLCKYSQTKIYGEAFGAKVFKISEDEKGQRLTHMKITGGVLRVKDIVADDSQEKVNEIRIYSGEKYTSAAEATAGCICAVTGLSSTFAGEGLGIEPNSEKLMLDPVFSYRVILPDNIDPYNAYLSFKRLEQEETQLHIVWIEHLKEIHLRLMGEVQLEVIKRVIFERFGIDAEFEAGGVIYKETITNKVEGVGHYEPLRHYAEVHLLIEPLKRGSGLKFYTKCREEVLSGSFQRLVLSHLAEKEHLGVLTGSPITDMKITLVSGRSHIKHTSGGDFRQAVYRAVRHGLMNAKSVLLEPWYSFKIELPTNSVGHAMSDITLMGGSFATPVSDGDTSYITGRAPAAKLCTYQSELTAYTHGLGRISCTSDGYEPCSNQDEIVDQIGYNPEADVENSPDSIFCSHGVGVAVKWNDVYKRMHLPSILAPAQEPELPSAPPPRHNSRSFADDKELMRIFEQTYGKIERKTYHAMRTPKTDSPARRTVKLSKAADRKNYLLVDGYNIIFAWPDLKELSKESLDLARTTLINRLCAYRAMRDTEVILVFDAYKVKGNPGSYEQVNNIFVVYTKEAETADAYIERTTRELIKNRNVRVATSDSLEQVIILGAGAFRVSASELQSEIESAEEEIRDIINNTN